MLLIFPLPLSPPYRQHMPPPAATSKFVTSPLYFKIAGQQLYYELSIVYLSIGYRWWWFQKCLSPTYAIEALFRLITRDEYFGHLLGYVTPTLFPTLLVFKMQCPRLLCHQNTISIMLSHAYAGLIYYIRVSLSAHYLIWGFYAILYFDDVSIFTISRDVIRWWIVWWLRPRRLLSLRRLLGLYIIDERQVCLRDDYQYYIVLKTLPLQWC